MGRKTDCETRPGLRTLTEVEGPEPARSTLRRAPIGTERGVGQPGVQAEMLDQSAEIEKFWCGNSRYPGVIQWNVDRHLVVERVEVKLSACVHCLHLDCDQEHPKKTRRNPCVGSCTRGPGHTVSEISRPHLGD